MSQNVNKHYRLGGISCTLAGVLFFLRYLSVFLVPSVPASSEVVLQQWLSEYQFNLQLSNELFFFATLSLILPVAVLYKLVSPTHPSAAIIGCGLFALVIATCIFLVIVQGRLVYPVYGLLLSPTNQKLVLSTYFGGMPFCLWPQVQPEY